MASNWVLEGPAAACSEVSGGTTVESVDVPDHQHQHTLGVGEGCILAGLFIAPRVFSAQTQRHNRRHRG